MPCFKDVFGNVQRDMQGSNQNWLVEIFIG